MRKKFKKDSFEFEGILDFEFGKGDFHHPDTLTADEILTTDSTDTKNHSALDSLVKRMTETPEKDTEIESKKTLLDKCMPYILDEDGNDTSVNQKPLYELASVAEILEADSKRTLEKLSKEYGIVFDDVSPITEEAAPKNLSEPVVEEAKPVIEEKTEEPLKEENPLPVISDIDIPDSPFYKIEMEEPSSEHTVTFTPLTGDIDSLKNTVVSTHTRAFDFTGEILKITDTAPTETESVTLEKSEFEEYIPNNEFEDQASGRQLLKGFAKKKKIGFFAMWGSILITLLTSIFLLPFMSNVILTHTVTCMIITSALTLTAIIINIKAFLGLGTLFSKKSKSDGIVGLACIAVILYSIFGIIGGEIILKMQIFLLITLSFYSINSFLDISSMLRSFKQIFSGTQKKGLNLINDPAITLAMTKGAVDGECLIAAGQSTDKIDGFMKHFTFGKFLNGRMGIINLISLLLSILSGIVAYVFFDNLLYGFYSMAAVLCLTASPILFLIDVLPVYHSSKKLALKGAMIAGKTGAAIIEEANAVVLNAKDIFPSGTVTLHRMQVLSENNLEDTILRAASLTEAMQSPLSPIFKQIAGNSNITAFPDSDTIKYEEALGISGWVDNRLLFIGNRTLLEAHGISVPDVELDRKILRQGFFPVYVASSNKACALLIVKYEADYHVAKELRRLSGSGVTLLIKTSDPNLTEEKICDYLGLYDDTVKVMSAAGSHIYVNTVSHTDSLCSPASYKTHPLGLPTILNCAARIKISNILLTSAYIMSAVFGVLLFAYASFGGSGSLISDTALLLYSIVTAVITYLVYLTQKP